MKLKPSITGLIAKRLAASKRWRMLIVAFTLISVAASALVAVRTRAADANNNDLAAHSPQLTANYSLSWLSNPRDYTDGSDVLSKIFASRAGTPLSAPMPFATTKNLSSGAAATAIWTTVSNWNPSGVPVATDEVVFDYTNQAGTKTTVVGVNAVSPGAFANSLTFGGSTTNGALAAFELRANSNAVTTARTLTLGTSGQSNAGRIAVDSSVTGTQSVGTNTGTNGVMTITLATGVTGFTVANNSTTQLLNLNSKLAEGATAGSTLSISSSGGVVQFGGANTYTGATTVNSGTLTAGAASVIPSGSSLTLNGGTFKSGATTGFTQSTGTLTLSDNSTIALGTGSHTLTFTASNGVSWTAAKTLTVTGWTGGYDGTSGTAGKIFVGSTASGLTASQLAQIVFFNGTSNFRATILSTGEVVPFTDTTPPTISYTAFADTTSVSNRTLSVTVTDISGVPTSGTGLPVIFFRKGSSGAYTSNQCSFVSGSSYNCIINYGLVSGAAPGNTIQYYVLAQDSTPTPNVASNPSTGASGFTASPPAASTPTTAPNSYAITCPGSLTVNDTGDGADATAGDGICATAGSVCTLRAAIQEANALTSCGGAITINFSIGSGVQTITPASVLPAITRPVIIDGTTQAGSSCTTVGGLTIELNGTSAGATGAQAGLELDPGASGSTIKGLVINRFGSYGLFVNSSSNNIQCNYVGTNVAGTSGLGNHNSGIRISGNSNLVGGTVAGNGNIFSANSSEGIRVGGTGTQIQGNYVGINAAGTAALPNGGGGVDIQVSSNTTVGGTSAGARNVISGHAGGSFGISIQSSSSNTIVQGNYIGTDATGTTGLGNSYGVNVGTGATGNTIGGIGVGEGNLIAFNSLRGVAVFAFGTTINNSVRGNSIFSNGALGIDLNGDDGVTGNDDKDPDTGPNNLQNFPVLTAPLVGATTVSGTLNSTVGATFIIDVYSNDACDPSGNGEGKTYLGSTTTSAADSNGNVSFNVTVPAVVSGKPLTATATDANGNTSEFSACASPFTTSTISGTLFDSNGNPISGGRTIKLIQNGTVSGTTATTNGSGVYTFTGLTLTSGDRLATFVDGAAEKGVTVTLSGTTDITNFDIKQNQLTVRTDNGGSPAITNTNLADADSSKDADIPFTVSSGTLTTAAGTSLQINFSSFYTPGGNITDGGDWTNNGTFTAGAFTAKLNSSAGNQAIGGNFDSFFSTLTIDNVPVNPTPTTSNVVTLKVNTHVSTALNVTHGVFNQGASASDDFTLVSNTVTVASGATWQNIGKGDVKLAGNVTNNGSVIFNSNGNACPEADDIVIRSSDTSGVVGTTQRTWSGTGTFSMTDVDVDYQRVPGPLPLQIIVNSGTDGTHNTGWTFTNTCTGPYTWIGGANQSWIVPSNWSPVRPTAASSSTTDVLIFDGTVTSAPTITNVPSQTNNSIQLKNGVFGVTLNAVTGGATLTLNGASGADLDVPSGTLLTLAGADPIVISLTASGHECTVAGQLVMQGGAHQLLGKDGAPTPAITMTGSNAFTTDSTYSSSTHPFGTSSTIGIVVFQSGVTGAFHAGLDPFGGAGKSVVTFNLGSVAKFFASSAFDTDGRTYGYLTLDGNQTYNGSGANETTVLNTFEIETGSKCILSSSAGGNLILDGSFLDQNTVAAFNPNGRIVKFNGGNTTQTISKLVGNAEPFFDVSINETAGGKVQLLCPVTINGQLNLSTVDSLLELNQNILTLNGTIVGSGNLKGDAAARLNINGTGALGTLNFLSGGRTLFELTMDRTSSGSAVFGNDMTVGWNLVLTNGAVDMGTFTLDTADATVSRGSGYVIGKLRKKYTGQGPKTFEVGTPNGYSPVDVDVTFQNFSPLFFTVNATGTKHPNIFGTNALSRYWTITPSVLSGFTADLTFHYLGADVVGTETNYKVFKYSGGTFTQPANQSVDSGAHTATVTGVTSFSDWTLAEIGSVDCPTISLDPPSLPHGVQGLFYNQTINALGGTGSYNFTAAGTLPDGITLDPGGSLEGTPTGTGTFHFTVTANDTNGCPGTKDYDLIIDPAPTNFIVNSTGDGDDVQPGDGKCDNGYGKCTLRAAMEEVNGLQGALGPMEIDFCIPANDPNHVYYIDDGTGAKNGHVTNDDPHIGFTTLSNDNAIGDIDPDYKHSWWLIKPAQRLPDIDQEVTIDAYTQPGAYKNTKHLNHGDNAVLRIEVNGSGLTDGSQEGFQLFSDYCTISGLVVDHFRTDIYIEDNGGDTIIGNFLGTEVSGTIADGTEGTGVFIDSGEFDTIGGETCADRNLISGHGGEGGAGVWIETSTVDVEGNYIGTDRDGKAALGNTYGVLIVGGSGNTIGCEVLDGDNVISGNTDTGVRISDGDHNYVQGNFIGTDRTGCQPLANGTGVLVFGGSCNFVGVPGFGNVISGNTGEGVEINNHSRFNQVQGNFIGVAADGQTDLHNGGNGVEVYVDSANNTIGVLPNSEIIIGPAEGTRRDAKQPQAAANQAKAPKVGDEGAMPIGDLVFGDNVIAFNLEDGVRVTNDGDINNRISQNQIYSNQLLGINLVRHTPTPDPLNEVTDNDSGDRDDGPNHLQNFPVITGVTASGGNGTVQFDFDTCDSGPYTIEFFVNPLGCDASGHGEGQTYIGSKSVSGSGSWVSDSMPINDGDTITATATDASGNTSEFSACFCASKPATPTATNDGPYCEGGTINLTTLAVGGATYSWTGPNGFTSSQQNPTRTNITSADAGAYSVATTLNGCPSDPGSTSVVINPTPATPSASGGGTYQAGATIQLHTPAVAEATYSWTGPNGFTSSQREPSITGATTANAGTYYVTITLNGCTSAPGSTDVVVNVPCPTAFDVNNNGDDSDANPGDGTCETAPGNRICTLRAAIEEANALLSCGTIQIDFAIGSSNITLTHGDLSVEHNVNIVGPDANSGNSITIDAHGASRIFSIGSDNTVSISNLNLTGGNGTGGIGSGSNGGAINNPGTLTLTGVALYGNTAVNGGAIASVTNNSVTLINTTISGNTATGNGGGLYNDVGQANLTNVTIAYNRSDSDGNPPGSGGGISIASGNVLLHNTIVTDNVTGASPGTTNDVDGIVLVSSSYNLIGTGSGGFNLTNSDGRNNQVGVASGLMTSLKNNGGPTLTHALLYNSPAVDAGDDCVVSGCTGNSPTVAIDQRGTDRTPLVDGDNNGSSAVDIGAYERQTTEVRKVGTGRPVPVDIVDATVTFPCVPSGNCLVDGNRFVAGQSNAGILPAASQSTVSLTEIDPNPPSQPAPPSGFVTGNNSTPPLPAFDVTPTNVNYGTPVTICFYLPSITNQGFFNSLKVFHNEAGVLVNRTSSVTFATKVVCAQVNSFSPFVIGHTVTPTAANGSVSGQILDNNGTPVEGAAVRMSGTQNRLTITDAGGNYHFDDVETNGLYVLTPSRSNFSFSPVQRTFSQLGAHTEATFTGAASANGLNPLDTTEYFVRQQYLDFLGREPDDAGFTFWVNNIDSCGADAGCREVRRVNTSAAFFLSIEFQQTGYLVYRAYESAYGNLDGAPVPMKLSEFKPDTREISNGVVVLQDGWQQKLENNKRAFIAEFVQRPRFANAYPVSMTPAQFVDKLFGNAHVLSTEPDYAAALTEFGTASDTSEVAARARVLRRMAENSTLTRQQFNQAFVLMQYFGYLQRDPNSGRDVDFTGYNFWLEKLDRFSGHFENAEMVKAFLSSVEYRGRFPR